MKEYQRITGKNDEITFRQLLLELGEIQKAVTEEETVSVEFDMLYCKVQYS